MSEFIVNATKALNVIAGCQIVLVGLAILSLVLRKL